MAGPSLDDPVQTAHLANADTVNTRSPGQPGLSANIIVPADALRRQRRKFGPEWPGLDGTGPEWRQWLDAQQRRQEPVMRDKRLHWMRHRYFRNGWQWISSRDGRTWKEPNQDENDIRMVLNLVGPALDFRLGILTEQRPGFRAEGMRSSSSAREWAEAQQLVSEYYYHKNQMWEVFRDAWYHAQTDGVAWVHTYVDKFAGPMAQDVELVPPGDPRYSSLLAQGYDATPEGMVQLPYDDEGNIAPVGTPVREFHQGDIASRMVLARETYCDPEARTVNGPLDRARWFVIRRVRDVKLARLETGNEKLEAEVVSPQSPDSLDRAPDAQFGWQRGLPPYPSQLSPRRSYIKEAVYEYLMYVAPDPEDLEQGAWRRIIGTEIVDGDDELPGSVIPVARITDGSSDTDMYPRPVMSDWIGDQIGINAIASLIMKTVRLYGGGRLMAPKGAIINETYSKIIGSIIEYTGQPPMAGPQPPAGMDAWKFLDWQVKKLEDKTGWNDLARGQLSGTGSFQDVSGRALLGARELFERTFGPMVRAAAQGATEWSHIVVRYAQWLFDEPRLIPAVGGSPRLAKMIKRENLGGEELLIYVDPETLMPLPRALRNQMLFDLLQNKVISLQEYKERAPYAEIRDVYTGGTEHTQRAQWINTVLEERWQELSQMSQAPSPMTGMPDPTVVYRPENGVTVLWQDDPGVHKLALQDIILDERKPIQLRALAWERWGIYDQLQKAQMDPNGMTPVPPVIQGVPQQQPGVLPPPPPPQPISHGAPKGAPGQTATSAAPETAPQAPPAASQMRPQPLGSFGAAEAAAQQRQQA